MLRNGEGRKKGSKGPRKRHNKPKKGEEESKGTSETGDRNEVSMEDVTKAMSALKFVPPSIRFGGRPRAGFSKKPASS